ncbi:MAG: M48 family metallopeptidase [Balneolales bacterium]|nr:M48 family metallopeptidase [Balneolales bacterium]
MHTITYGKKSISYELKFSERKTLGIEVYPDMRVVVIAPEGTADAKIITKVKSKAPWIVKQLRDFEKYQPLSVQKKFVSGETHLYLGRQYILKTEPGRTGSVKLRGKYIHVTTPKQEKTEELLYEWYRVKAEHHFAVIIKELLPEFVRKEISIKDLIIRKMNTRWGSCTPAGTITLNLHLIKAPRRCIEYIILHELCHLVYHKHDSRFYGLLGSLMPNWKNWKEKLELMLA